MRALTLLPSLVLVACSAAPASAPPSQPRPLATRAPSPPASLPAGILAQAEGKNGWVRVERRGNLRVLTIDGVVQGAVADDAPGSLAAEPMVGLVRAFRPNASSALVIGLGTGRTAAALSNAGLTPEVVELEPAVVDFAKQFFNYRGHTVVDDGLAFVRKQTRQYDIILIDANLGDAIPAHLVTDQALRAYQERLTPEGVLLVRTNASPEDAQPASLFRRLPHHLKLMFGTGVGAERQNLYLLSSEAPLFAEDLRQVAAWPVLIPGGSTERVPRSTPDADATRNVSVLGYVIRTEDGSLCLDLPHWEMGAVRYLLVGSEAEALGRRLAAKTTFPTAGDIRSDGDPSNTLQSMLGGGGVKRSDVRFSPLAAMVKGRARARVITHPDDAWVRSSPGPRRLHPMLPYGGVLYELTVESVPWTFDIATWSRVRRVELQPLVTKARRALLAGDLVGGLEGVAAYGEALAKSIGAPALSLSVTREVAGLESLLRSEASAAPRGDFEVGAACDRVASGLSRDGVNPDLPTLRGALQACAVRRYQRVARGGESSARAAAARLIELLEFEPELAPGADGILRALRKRFPALEPAGEPPSRRLVAP